jgi:hypothetical protein
VLDPITPIVPTIPEVIDPVTQVVDPVTTITDEPAATLPALPVLPGLTDAVLDPIDEAILPVVTGATPSDPNPPAASVLPDLTTPLSPGAGTIVPPAPLGGSQTPPASPGETIPFFGDIQDFMDAGGSGSGLMPPTGMLALLPPSVVALWSAAQGVSVSIDSAGHLVFGVGSSSDAPPSQPSPERPTPPTQAPGGATAGGGSGGTGFFSGTLFAALFALMGLAALRTSRLAMASAHLRPQAYIALLERPG